MFGLTYHLTPVKDTSDVYTLTPTKTTWMIALAPTIFVGLVSGVLYAQEILEERRMEKLQPVIRFTEE